MKPETLEETSRFWDANPCDAQGTHAERERFRFGKEPWLRPKIEAIAARHRQILEIGCGQGTDALAFCRALPEGAEYIGVDYSAESVKAAERALAEARAGLRVVPTFRRDNAESLSIETASIEAVYSMGVLHHTPDTAKAVAEVHRVLKPGGKAYIILYRTLSPKLLGAHAARAAQAGVDRVLGTERFALRLARKLPIPAALGTAIQECFGVPVLRSYTRRQMRELFSAFRIVSLTSHGSGLPPGRLARLLEPRAGDHPLGYFWMIECAKD